MPKITTTVSRPIDIDTEVEVADFLDYCSDDEKELMVEILQKENFCAQIVRSSGVCVAEAIYQEAIRKLLNSWNMLSIEDEQRILKIANKF